MIGLGNDYLVNYEFAWTKTPSKNLLGYFSLSSVPAARPTKEIKGRTPSVTEENETPQTLSTKHEEQGERVCGVCD